MTDKSDFRAEKNERIAAKIKAREKEQEIKKEKKSELDNKSHWRFRKNQGIHHGTTSMKDIAGKQKEKEVKKPSKEEIAKSNKSTTPDGKVNPKNIKFTKESAKALNRDQQEELLVQRMVKFTAKDKESDLIEKIINSNPKA